MAETILLKTTDNGLRQYRLVQRDDKKYVILWLDVAPEAEFLNEIGVFNDEKKAKEIFEKI